MHDGFETPVDRVEQFRRVHITADQRQPFGTIRSAEPPRSLRYGKPSLVERLLSRVFG